MSWDKLEVKVDPKAQEKQKEALVKIAKNYAVCFSTVDGKEVLQHLVSTFVMSNDTGFNSQNINYEAAYRNGEAGLVKQILKQIERAQTL